MAGTLKAQRGRGGGGIGPEETLVPALAATLSSGGHPNSNMPGRRKEDDVNLVAFHMTQDPISGDVAPAMSRGNRQGTATIGVAQASGVRRLTPRECERLQGFPDDYTLIPYRRGMAKDGPRYRALGNSMAVPVMRWIGRRIAAVDAAVALERAA